jgi:DNA-binding response OmpR family regulator
VAGTVLVVDDEPEFLRVARGYLEDDGFSVFTAGTATEGAELAARRHPDVILLDLLLPERGGLDLLRALKEDPETRAIPVLVASVAREGPKALSLGAAECLLKPVDRASLVSRVRRLLVGSTTPAPTVLVVDDEADTLDFMRETLKSEGFRVITAHDGQQALHALERERLDLVILDILLPGLSGFEVLEAMARSEDTAAIPVVVLTAQGDEVDARRGLELGVRKYLSKPFDVRALLAEVRRQVAGRSEGARETL